MSVTFFVPGIPKPGGSKRAFTNKYTGKAQIVEDCETSKNWRGLVAHFALEAMRGLEIFEGPIMVAFRFQVPRPKGHYRKNRSLTGSAPAFPAVKPDVLKLSRSTEDALTGIVYRDDAQIVHEVITKFYVTVQREHPTLDTTIPGCVISIANREKTNGVQK